MEELLKNFELEKILVFFAPGASFAIFRSFAIRGSFPGLSKDDLGAVVIASAVYTLCLRIASLDAVAKDGWQNHSTILWIIALTIVPSVLGFLSGYVEGSDLVGVTARSFGIRLPSPDETAWGTVFRELPIGSILIVRLGDDTVVAGRWLFGCATSQKDGKGDLYLAEIGELSVDGDYEPCDPMRGAYFAAGEIRLIEIVRPPSPQLSQSLYFRPINP